MNARTRAMMAHPAGKGLMSEDEAQARQDAEACQLGSLNWRANEARHNASTGPRKRWLEIALPALTTVSVVGFLLLDVFILNGPVIA